MKGVVSETKLNVVCVTGERGLVGSRLLRRLSTEYDVVGFGDQVRSWEHFADKINTIAPDFIIHCAGKRESKEASRQESAKVFKDNKKIDDVVLRYVRSCTTVRAIFIGSTLAYGSALGPLNTDKLRFKRSYDRRIGYSMAKSRVIRTVMNSRALTQRVRILIPPVLFDPNENSIDSRAPRVVHFPSQIFRQICDDSPNVTLKLNPRQKMNLIYLDDLITAINLVLKKFDEAPALLNVAYDQQISVLEFVTKITKNQNVDIEFDFDSSEKFMTDQTIDNQPIRKLGWEYVDS